MRRSSEDVGGIDCDRLRGLGDKTQLGTVLLLLEVVLVQSWGSHHNSRGLRHHRSSRCHHHHRRGLAIHRLHHHWLLKHWWRRLGINWLRLSHERRSKNFISMVLHWLISRVLSCKSRINWFTLCTLSIKSN